MDRNFGYALLLAPALSLPLDVAQAVEGATGTYLLGSRDIVMGIVPPPGVYLTNESIFYSGDIKARTNLAGAIVENAHLEVFIDKITGTFVAPGQVFGGSAGFSVVVPFVNGKMDAKGSVTLPGFGTISGNVDAGDASGLSDITLVPMIGWHSGKVHTSFAVAIYLPTGSYENATINLADRSADAVNPGKNRAGVDPTFSITYLDTATGLELDGSVGVVFTEKNDATDYQSGAEMHIEGTVAQRLPGGWLIGINGQYYQQLEDDSGAGADQLKAALVANDLTARVFGLGPVVSYSTKIGDVGVTLTGKYLKQFGAEKFIEGESGWLKLGLSF